MNRVEQRKHERYKTEIIASIHTQNETLPGTLDISRGGFKMALEKEVHPDTKLVIELKSLGEYAFKGIVKWSSQERQEQKSVYFIGVEVEDILWTNLKVVHFIKWSEFVERVVSEGAGQN